MKIFYSPECLGYGQAGHPESAERIERTAALLRERGFAFSEPGKAGEKDLLLCHSREHVEQVKGGFQNPDTSFYPNIFELACLSAGSAIQAMRSALEGESGFSLMRPPGHHASSRPEGFCYFNNLAIAVKRALEKVGRVAIVDFDAHFGNGTQGIFLGDERVLFVSLHQGGIYPGTGLVSERNCINFPLSAFTGERDYLDFFEKGMKEVKKFSPELIGVSAGFDGHREDPITSLGLTEGSFRKIGERISSLKLPVFAVMEGGYSGKVAESVWEFLKGMEQPPLI